MAAFLRLARSFKGACISSKVSRIFGPGASELLYVRNFSVGKVNRFPDNARHLALRVPAEPEGGSHKKRRASKDLTPVAPIQIALVGRPNVGKSTLFNRLTKTKRAIVHDVPGTTRDVQKGKGNMGGVEFSVVDTGGMDEGDAGHDSIERQMLRHTKRELQRADVIFFIVDGRSGLTQDDIHFSRWMHGLGLRSRVCVVVNKLEGCSAVELPTFGDDDALPAGGSAFEESWQEIGEAGLEATAEAAEAVEAAAARAAIWGDESGLSPSQGGSYLVSGRHYDPAVGRGGGGTGRVGLKKHALNVASMYEVLLEVSRLGFGAPLSISAEHGEGVSALFPPILSAAEAKARELDALVREAAVEAPGGIAPSAGEKAHAATLPMRPVHAGRTEPAVAAGPGDGATSAPRPISLAIVGRPNVGKSSLINALVREEVAVTGPQPGVTRDAVELSWSFGDTPITLVDTAGVRKPAKWDESNRIDELSVASSFRAIDFAHVVALVVDVGLQAFTHMDLEIGNRALDEGRALLVVANKTDLLLLPTNNLPPSPRVISGLNGGDWSAPAAPVAGAGASDVIGNMRLALDAAFPQAKGLPLVPVSSLTGRGLHAIMPAVVALHERWNARVATALLNQWLRATVAHKPPGRAAESGSGTRGRSRIISIKYITQVRALVPLLLPPPLLPPHCWKRALVHFIAGCPRVCPAADILLCGVGAPLVRESWLLGPQASSRPPTFVLFSNTAQKDFPVAYLRFLTNQLREEFDMAGVPVRLVVRQIERRRRAAGGGLGGSVPNSGGPSPSSNFARSYFKLKGPARLSQGGLGKKKGLIRGARAPGGAGGGPAGPRPQQLAGGWRPAPAMAAPGIVGRQRRVDLAQTGATRSGMARAATSAAIGVTRRRARPGSPPPAAGGTPPARRRRPAATGGGPSGGGPAAGRDRRNSDARRQPSRPAGGRG